MRRRQARAALGSLLSLLTLWRAPVAQAADTECASYRRNVITQQRLFTQQIDRRLFSSIGVWDNLRKGWQPLLNQQPIAPRARVVVVNLWSHYCQPCIRELPTLLSALRDASLGRSAEVQLLLLAEDTTSQDMESFLARNPSLPREGYYNDTGGEIRRELGAGTQLPMTLLLDRDLVVRYAVVGAVEDFGELKDQVDRLLRVRRQ
ncbi:MAG: TlpA disulfide reductase family protein [Polyangia bacterium]